jgi:hypothetical protein
MSESSSERNPVEELDEGNRKGDAAEPKRGRSSFRIMKYRTPSGVEIHPVSLRDGLERQRCRWVSPGGQTLSGAVGA